MKTLGLVCLIAGKYLLHPCGEHQLYSSMSSLGYTSPCGTGTSAVMTKHYFEGNLKLHEPFVHESIIGTQFTGKVVEEVTVGPFRSVATEITGSAWITQYCHVVLDKSDPFPEGFTVGDIWG